MPTIVEDLLTVAVDTSTSGDNTIIADPGDGKFIAIDFLTLNPNGGGQTLLFKNCVPSGSNLTFTLDDNQPLTFENTTHHMRGILTVNASTAFVLNLGSATQVTGFIRYRIVD